MDGESGPGERLGAWHAIVDRSVSQGTKGVTGRGTGYQENGEGRICKLTSSGSELGELIVRSKCLMLKAFGGWDWGRRSTDIGE